MPLNRRELERLEKETGESWGKNLTKNEKKAKVPEEDYLELNIPGYKMKNDEWTSPAIRHFGPQLTD